MELGIFSLYYITNNFHYKFQKEFKRIQKVSDSWKIPFFFSYILRSKAANIPCFQYLGLGHVRCTWELRKITLQAVPMYPHLPSTNYLFTAWKVAVFGVILVSIFPHLDWIRRGTDYPSAFSPNAGKCWPE